VKPVRRTPVERLPRQRVPHRVPHGLRNVFITVAERDLLLPHSLTKRLANHAPPSDVTEGYAADWTIGQLREPAQRIADRIEALMMSEGETGAESA